MYKFKSIPVWLQDKWDRQLEGWHDAIKGKRPLSQDQDYLLGYNAKMSGRTLKQEVMNYMIHGGR